MKIYAGFDCGGSSSRCLLVNEDGEKLGVGKGGPSNYLFIGRESAAENIRTAIRLAFEQAGIPEQPIEGIFVASAAVEVFDGARHEAYFKEVTGCQQIECDSDIFPVWYAGGEPGKRFEPLIAMISGTGAVTYLLKKDSFIKEDGWGPILGDEGSGYAMGLATVKKVTRMIDRRDPMDQEFYDAVMDFYEVPKDNPRRLLRAVSGEERFTKTASVTRVLEGLYRKGNPIAAEIYEKASDELALSGRTALDQFEGKCRLVLSGGSLRKGAPLQELLCKKLEGHEKLETIVIPDKEAVVSAASIALMRAGKEAAAEKLMAEV